MTPSIVLLLNFNSIKVRLELAFSLGEAFELLFQFHKGAIRTISALSFGLVVMFISIP